jgi:hypothetical protein
LDVDKREHGAFQSFLKTNFCTYRKVCAYGKSWCLATVRFGFVRAYAPNSHIGVSLRQREFKKTTVYVNECGQDKKVFRFQRSVTPTV